MCSKQREQTSCYMILYCAAFHSSSANFGENICKSIRLIILSLSGTRPKYAKDLVLSMPQSSQIMRINEVTIISKLAMMKGP